MKTTKQRQRPQHDSDLSGPALISKQERARLFCYGLGHYYADRNDYTHSLEYYNQSIKLDNNFTAAWNSKGMALANLGRYETLKNFKATKIDPNYSHVWNTKE